MRLAATVLEVAAFGLITYGVWLWRPWLGFVVGGLLLALLAHEVES